MADGLNRVMLLGNLGADPELRVTQGGSAILKLRLATTESYLDKNNTRQERTEWHQVSLWGKRGEALSKFLKKGDRVFIEGSLRTSSYEKNGEKRYSTEIMAQNVILAGGGGGRRDDRDEPMDRAPRTSEGRGGYGGGRPASGPPRDMAPPPADGFDDFGPGGMDDDIPF